MENGKELKSFKDWFKIMWQNSYIQIFAVAIVAIIFQIVNMDVMIEIIVENFSYSFIGGIMATIAILIPILVATVVVYKGFYQFWNELKGKV